MLINLINITPFTLMGHGAMKSFAFITGVTPLSLLLDHAAITCCLPNTSRDIPRRHDARLLSLRHVVRLPITWS